MSAILRAFGPHIYEMDGTADAPEREAIARAILGDIGALPPRTASQ